MHPHGDVAVAGNNVVPSVEPDEVAELLHGGLAYLDQHVIRCLVAFRQGNPVQALAVAQVRIDIELSHFSLLTRVSQR
uniref:Uncharacterized protein n=1 Tax=Pseudomonas aeruginosa TaxID=287 RepID=B3G2I6_PSEAI|nr:hypothetical protein PACL_0460 [Pseudomonas aeruginosa]